MFNPEKAQSGLEATYYFHICHLIKYVTVLQYFLFFMVSGRLIYISETADISGNGSVYFGGHKNISWKCSGLAFIILLLNHIIEFQLKFLV